jgi:simple sugar transport system permease protein
MTVAETQVAAPQAPPPSRGRRVLMSIVTGNFAISLLAVVAAVIVGSLMIAVTDKEVQTAAGYFFQRPGDTFQAVGSAVGGAYAALFRGSVYNFNADSFAVGIRPLTETLKFATPLIAAGLGVGLAFRAGLFNIGGQGQIIAGAICAGFVGFHWHMPAGIHLIAAVIAGIVGGALWGGIAGFLKARTGAHEVITTIMLNYVAINLLGYLLSVKGFQAPPYGQAIANPVDHNATLPLLLGSTLRVHLGLVLSLAAALFVWWLLTYSRLGFRLRAVGANPAAARTAGMSVENSYIVVMLISGALCGLAGVSQVLGTNPSITGDIDSGIGFDAITVALLGRANPVGTVFAGLLFGALRAGSPLMQAYAPNELVQVIQALIVLFIAAPAVIRTIFRLKTSGSSMGADLAKGWNG